MFEGRLQAVRPSQHANTGGEGRGAQAVWCLHGRWLVRVLLSEDRLITLRLGRQATVELNLKRRTVRGAHTESDAAVDAGALV